jgi:hypothetical protein
MSLNKFAAFWEDMDETLKQWRNEAVELRESIPAPSVSDNIHSLHEQIVAARRAQDRLESIVGDLGLLRSRLRKLVAELQAEFDDKFAQNVINDRVGEYSSAKAQDARYSAGALVELRNLRKAKKMLLDVEDVYDYVNLRFRGTDSARRDIDSRIRIINLESQLER